MKNKLAVIGVLSIIGAASANSTAAWGYDGTHLDYYWVPGNMLLFHISYPWDFLLYILAAIGALYCIWQAYGFFLRMWP